MTQDLDGNEIGRCRCLWVVWSLASMAASTASSTSRGTDKLAASNWSANCNAYRGIPAKRFAATRGTLSAQARPRMFGNMITKSSASGIGDRRKAGGTACVTSDVARRKTADHKQ